MSVLTLEPGVALALIFGLLLVIGLVAFNRRAAENILRFFTGLLDLYQRLQCLRRLSYSLPEQNAKSAAPVHNPSADRTMVTDNAVYALSALQQQGASDRMGE